jgi:peroxiredoxin
LSDGRANSLRLISGKVSMPALQVGEIAPDFELQAVTGEKQHAVRLSDFRGQKHVVLAFHPLDWTPT